MTSQLRQFFTQPVPAQGFSLSRLIRLAVWSALSFALCSHFLYSSVIVLGDSMEPTLRQGDRLVVNHWSYRLKQIHRGELVVLNDLEAGTRVIKRVIGLPGEIIQLREDGVYINGRRLEEPYVPRAAYTFSRRMGERPLHLANGEYFVLGDNRLRSVDSRWYGPVRQDDIRGTAGLW